MSHAEVIACDVLLTAPSSEVAPPGRVAPEEQAPTTMPNKRNPPSARSTRMRPSPPRILPAREPLYQTELTSVSFLALGRCLKSGRA